MNHKAAISEVVNNLQRNINITRLFVSKLQQKTILGQKHSGKGAKRRAPEEIRVRRAGGAAAVL